MPEWAKPKTMAPSLPLIRRTGPRERLVTGDRRMPWRLPLSLVRAVIVSTVKGPWYSSAIPALPSTGRFKCLANPGPVSDSTAAISAPLCARGFQGVGCSMPESFDPPAGFFPVTKRF